VRLIRLTSASLSAVLLLLVSGCGSSAQFANRSKPAIPVNLTVYINDARVSLSPASVGAGQVIFIVTNQGSKSQSLQIVQAGGGSDPLATTGPINPQGTAQVKVNLRSTGTYVISTGAAGATDAQLTTRSTIRPARLEVSHARPSARNILLVP